MGFVPPQQPPIVPADPEILNTLIALQRERKLWLSFNAKATSVIGAQLVRTIIPQGDIYQKLKAAYARADKIMMTYIRGLARTGNPGKQASEDDERILRLHIHKLDILAGSLVKSLQRLDEVVLDMEKTADKLPITQWVCSIPGLKRLAVAVIVGETTNPSFFPTSRHILRYLGYGMEDEHKAHAYSTWRKGLGSHQLTAQDWTEAKYNPHKLSQIFGVVTTPLFMHKAKSEYGTIYDERRAHTLITHPEWYKPDKKNPGQFTSGHGMMDAKRIMTKAFIRKFWNKWGDYHGIRDFLPELYKSVEDHRMQELSKLEQLPGPIPPTS